MVTITVKYKNPPKEGKANWSIKESDGSPIYLVKEPLASQVQIGGEYELTYHDWTAKDGTTFHLVDTVKATATPKRNIQEMAPAGQRSNPNFDKNMFVMAMMKSCLEGGLIKELKSDMTIAAIKHWQYVWDSTLGNPQRDDEMGDHVPF